MHTIIYTKSYLYLKKNKLHTERDVLKILSEQLDMVVHAFNSSTLEGKDRQISVSTRTAWYTQVSSRPARTTRVGPCLNKTKQNKAKQKLTFRAKPSLHNS